LAEADATINSLWHDALRLEEENTVMVQQIVEISRELQEARDSEAEARMLHRQRVQMFHGFSARIMEAANRLGIEGLTLPTIPEDDGSTSSSSANWLKSWWKPRPKSWSSSTPSVGSS
jgi:hypothetical protein